MNRAQGWRSISLEEVAVIKAIVGSSTPPDCDDLLSDIDSAVVAHEAPWVLDVQTARTTKPSRLPNGPFPVRAYVPSRADYRGEVIVWLTDGRISGLEYAWITDQAPTRWPDPRELDIVPN